jgi:hypothetical protein
MGLGFFWDLNPTPIEFLAKPTPSRGHPPNALDGT